MVAVRSAVVEAQYVDLRPSADTGPYLRDGDVIPASHTGTPLPVETLLSNLDGLVRSVDGQDLTTLIDELGPPSRATPMRCGGSWTRATTWSTVPWPTCPRRSP